MFSSFVTILIFLHIFLTPMSWVYRNCPFYFTDSNSRLSQDSADYADYAIPPDAMPDSLPDSVPTLRLPGLCRVDFVESVLWELSYGLAEIDGVVQQTQASATTEQVYFWDICSEFKLESIVMSAPVSPFLPSLPQSQHLSLPFTC